MPRVMPANPYLGDLGSFGQGCYELIAQFAFPDTYEEGEPLHEADHDRLRMWHPEHFRGALQRHIHTGEGAIGRWAQRASKESLLAFCVDILKADTAVAWTGCRVMGTVNRSNGFTCWTISVFAKDPTSRTKVYTGENAPNVNPLEPADGSTYFSRRKQ